MQQRIRQQMISQYMTNHISFLPRPEADSACSCHVLSMDYHYRVQYKEDTEGLRFLAQKGC